MYDEVGIGEALRAVADRVELEGLTFYLDTNGNDVGRYYIAKIEVPTGEARD
jgi:hypothetical protein